MFSNGRKAGVFSFFGAIALLVSLMTGCGSGGTPPPDAAAVLDEICIVRGICVVAGGNADELALDLARRSHLTLFVMLPDAENVATARRKVDDAGMLGTRITVDAGLSRIPLADNIADAVIAYGRADKISDSEILRVLNPLGKAMVGEKILTKPFPAGTDDWSHPGHGPDNNPQSNDTIARAPYLTRFLAAPYYAPMPQMTVSSAGRVFRALGHIAFKPREEALVNTLMAYNGYNGTVLWKRSITPGIMVHRNTMVATPSILYYADDTSCKMIDTATGEIMDEISPPADVTGGTFWKWMALEDGVLYALIGEDEMRDPEVRNSWPNHGWPWDPLSKGYNLPENPWGYGGTIVAIDPSSKKILWTYREESPVDSRSVCMKNGRMYLFGFGSFITCLDTANGSVEWQKTAASDPGLFTAIGRNLNRQDWQTNWRTAPYLSCSDDALYFAGPMFDKLIVLSAADGTVLWKHPYDNYQLVLRGDGLYGISGPWADKQSRRFDPLTGEILGEFAFGRRACTRPTGSADAIFLRADGGSVRFDLASHSPHYVSPMRPSCFDGVTVANGSLYWWPSVCDCQLTLYGATCLGPAGDHDFYPNATEDERLETLGSLSADGSALDISGKDWPMFRADASCTARTGAVIPEKARELWRIDTGTGTTPTAPVAAGGMVYTAGSNGAVRALRAETGEEVWRAYTGGCIRIAPTVWEGRVFAGSGDGCAYAFDAATGKPLWRFRAAPEERTIPVYGTLMSTWPAASGVLVDNGIAYVAAGISNYDGVYVYALDAETGQIRWQNNSSGHLNREARCGAGVQGHLLLHDGKLHMAGGNAVSPAVYDIANGRCLNHGDSLNICESICLRGWELYLVGDKVAVGGQPFYRDPRFPVVDQTVVQKLYHASAGDRDIVWMDGARLLCYPPIDREALSSSVYERAYPGHYVIAPWGKFETELEPYWGRSCEGSRAVAVCANAVVVVTDTYVAAADLKSGDPLWSFTLDTPPVPWGLAVDRDGRVVVSLEDGRVVCYGAAHALSSGR